MMVILFVFFFSPRDPFTLVMRFDFWSCVGIWLQQTGLLMMRFVCWHTYLTNCLLLFCGSSMGEVELNNGS